MAVKMRNLKPGEKVDIVIRRHWIAFLLLGIYFFSGLIFTLMILGILGLSVPVLLLMVIFWMFYCVFLYITWINYELDIFIFTNNRLVCIEQKSFLNRAVGETTLDKVQEVAIETKGLFANLFDYGTMRIMTAGASPSFDMTFAPDPMKHARYINNLVDRYRDNLYGGGQKKEKNTVAQVDSVLKAGV